MELISSYNRDDILAAVRSEGLSLTAIAGKLGVSVEMVRHVIAGRRTSSRINEYLLKLLKSRLTMLYSYRQQISQDHLKPGNQAVNQ